MKHHTTTEFFNIGEIELSYKKQIETPFQKITSSQSANECIRKVFPINQINYREHMCALYLNNDNKVLGYQLLSIGGITATLLDVRILIQGALLTNSVALILFHNHPSGKLNPSKADVELTKKVSSSLGLLDLKLLDHLIITETNYYSFADEGMV
ncbi:JAB domain-containing protein [Tenacibaculum xiamenense]|uniref:JAB domain-containing protein n=1 Tax=Tenacibaculum xiamenense TaxID=1261553 RepID=UPI0038967FC3